MARALFWLGLAALLTVAIDGAAIGAAESWALGLLAPLADTLR